MSISIVCCLFNLTTGSYAPLLETNVLYPITVYEIVSHHVSRTRGNPRHPPLQAVPIPPYSRQRVSPPFPTGPLGRGGINISTRLFPFRLHFPIAVGGGAAGGPFTPTFSRLEVREAGANRCGTGKGGQEASSKHRPGLGNWWRRHENCVGCDSEEYSGATETAREISETLSTVV